MRVLVGVLCFTTKQEIQDGGQRELRILSNAMNAGYGKPFVAKLNPCNICLIL